MTNHLVDELFDRMTRQRDLMRALDVEIRTLVVSVTTQDGSVAVEVDGLGAMIGLRLTKVAYRQGPERLGRVIVETAGAAADVAARRLSFLVERFSAQLTAIQGAG